MKEVLQELAKARQGFVELRFHKRISNSFMAQKGRVDVANNSVTAGVGVRALVDGAWGFAATADLSKQAINRAIDQAQRNAKTLAKVRKKEKIHIARANLSTQDFVGEGFRSFSAADLDEEGVGFADSSGNDHTYGDSL